MNTETEQIVNEDRLKAELQTGNMEPGDTDARAEVVGMGCFVVVDGFKWFVDLADLMEQRVPGRDCGRRAPAE